MTDHKPLSEGEMTPLTSRNCKRDKARTVQDRINMLRVALSTIEEVAQNGRRAEALKLFRVFSKTARHALDRDAAYISSISPQ